MNGWSLSGSQKANHHWQSGNTGNKGATFNLMQRGSASGLQWLIKYTAYYYGYTGIKYNVIQELNLPRFGLNTKEDLKKYPKVLTLDKGKLNYFKMEISNLHIPAYMDNISWYIRNFYLSYTVTPNAITFSPSEFKTNKSVKSILYLPTNTETHIYTTNLSVKLQDIGSAQYNGILLSNGTTKIYFVIDATNNTSDYTVTIFPCNINLDYEYNEITDFSLYSDKQIYIGYWLNELSEIVELENIGKSNFTDEQKARYEELTDFTIKVSLSKITEDIYNAQKYGATN